MGRASGRTRTATGLQPLKGARAGGQGLLGTITGGTGRYAGLEGEFSFTWQYVVSAEDGAFQGRAVGLKGRVRRRRELRDERGRPRPTGSCSSRASASWLLAVGLWFSPVPEGLVPRRGTSSRSSSRRSSSVVIGALPILTSSVLALAAAVLSGTLAPAKAYAGFANGTILLIVVAFLVARAVVKCGLGERLGHSWSSAFGRSTLGLATASSWSTA